MITEENQKIFCNLLMDLSKGENSILITRKILSNSLNYSPHFIFSHFFNSQQITDIDLFNYLIYNNISCSKTEAKLIILFYDKNRNDVLSYDEFIQLINGKENLSHNFLGTNNNIIDDNIKFLFNKILIKELELCRKFIINLKKLRTRNDFDIHKVFHFITNTNFINKFSLEKFFQLNKISFLDSDINNIIKRIDINKDGVIDIKEFTTLFDFPKSIKNNYHFTLCKICKGLEDKPMINKMKSNLKINNNIREISITHNNRYNENIKVKSMSQDFSKNKHHNISDETFKKGKTIPTDGIKGIKFCSQDNIFNTNINRNQESSQNFYSTLKNNRKMDIINNLKNLIFLLKNKKSSERKQNSEICPKNYYNPNVKTYRITEIDFYINTNQNFFEKFNGFLKLIMQVETQIENQKIYFFKNLKIFFKGIYLIFDEDDKGYITEEELKNGLYKIKIIDEDSCDILMSRYDILKRKIIKESEFFDMIVPFNKIYRKKVENDITEKGIDEYYEMLEDVNTFSCLKNLLLFIINKEKQINNYKINFIEKKSNSNILNSIFNTIDREKRGFFSYEDLIFYLKINNLIVDNYAVALLFIRLDKKRKGIIYFEDLIQEL